MPRRLYGISKLASELITERYGDLFGLSTASVRPSSVYGTMDRVTASRNFRHVPNRIAHLAVDGVKCVRVNTLSAVGDYIHAEDVARAIVALLLAPALRYSAYNIAAGSTATVGDLVGLGRGEGAGISRRDRSRQRGRYPAGCGVVRRHVGRLRYFAHHRRDRLAAAPGARGAACLHGLDRGGTPRRHLRFSEGTWSTPTSIRAISSATLRARPTCAGRTTPGSRCPSCSTTKKAARTACCTATRTRNRC